VVIGLAAALLTGCQSDPGSSSGAITPATPSQILKNFEMQDIHDGVTSMRLVSIEGQVYDQEHLADVSKPIVTFYKLGKESSVMNAPFGKVYLLTHAVEAWGGVTVVNVDSTTLTTDRLTYDPQRQKIISKDAVRIEKPDSITEGIGLEADPDLTHIKMGRQRVRLKKALGTP